MLHCNCGGVSGLNPRGNGLFATTFDGTEGFNFLFAEVDSRLNEEEKVQFL